MTADRRQPMTIGSAGVSALDGCPPTQETIEVMSTLDIDVSGHRSRNLTMNMVRGADKIVVMEKFHKDLIMNACLATTAKIHLLNEFSSDPAKADGEIAIPDPIQMSAEFYMGVLEMIKGCMPSLVKSLTDYRITELPDPVPRGHVSFGICGHNT